MKLNNKVIYDTSSIKKSSLLRKILNNISGLCKFRLVYNFLMNLLKNNPLKCSRLQLCVIQLFFLPGPSVLTKSKILKNITKIKP